MTLWWVWLACGSNPPPPAGWFSAVDHPASTVAPPEGARSLVVIVGCTVRVDQLTPYGGPPELTPALAGLAAGGVVFDDVIAAAPWTRPAVTAIFTGRHPGSVGMTDPGPGPDARQLPPSVVTLAQHLADRGWTTLGVSANPNVHTRFGLDRGFQRWRQPDGRWVEDAPKLGSSEVLGELRQLLAVRDPARPALVVVVLVDAHAPYLPTAVERLRFADETVPPEVVDYRIALRRFDDGVRDVVALARASLGEDTLISVVSDHGEGLSFPARHGPSHGRHLAPTVVRTAWVLAGDGLAGPRRLGGTVSQIDLAPTLTSLAGAPGFPGAGVDRSASVRGDAPIDAGLAFVDTRFREVDRAGVYTATRACQLDFSGAPPTDGFVDGCFDRTADPTHGAPFDVPDLQAAVVAFRAAPAIDPVPVVADDVDLDHALEALGYR